MTNHRSKCAGWRAKRKGVCDAERARRAIVPAVQHGGRDNSVGEGGGRQPGGVLRRVAGAGAGAVSCLFEHGEREGAMSGEVEAACRCR